MDSLERTTNAVTHWQIRRDGLSRSPAAVTLLASWLRYLSDESRCRTLPPG